MEENREQSGWQVISSLAGRMHLRIPEEYRKPSDEVAAEKFPVTPRPQEIYINPEGNRILTFNLLDKPLQEQQVYPAVLEMQRVISHAYPESIRVQAKELKTDAGMIGWFAFVTGGIREDSMHCMFILPLDDNMMLGSYHFPAEQMEEERRIFMQRVKSIQLEVKSASGKQGGGNETGI